VKRYQTSFATDEVDPWQEIGARLCIAAMFVPTMGLQVEERFRIVALAQLSLMGALMAFDLAQRAKVPSIPFHP
jgi:hypothetical protein